jgi:ElaB/YqjD/DUF883 family membrane-anchored ribosome-binding protein
MEDYKPGASSPGESTAAAGTASRMKEQVANKAGEMQDKVSGMASQATSKINESRSSVAGALEQAASSVAAGADKASGLAKSAGDKLQASAQYVRENDVKKMGEDAQDLIKRYPFESVAVAAVLGFLIAGALPSRRD